MTFRPTTFQNAAPSNAGSYAPSSIEELTQRNIETIAQLEKATRNERTTSNKIADRIASFCGSVGFVWAHVFWFGGWVTLNTLHGVRHIDPFPFPFLTLVTSLEAIFLTTFVLISQNRQSWVAERRNHLDLQINLLAEQENSKILTMLDAIARRLGIPDNDPEISALQNATEPDKLVRQIDAVIERDEAPVRK